MKAANRFLILGLLSLAFAVTIGSLAMLSYLYPEQFKEALPFRMLRPMHVSSAVAWLFLTISGLMYRFLPEISKKKFNVSLINLHFYLFLIGGILILGSYFLNKYGGREYWAFPPFLALFILASWLLFIYNFISNLKNAKLNLCPTLKGYPVYLWMWLTGLIFFLFTFLEVYAWLVPYFQEKVTLDLTVQWKAYGSLVGSWNMFIYGTALFVMTALKNDKKTYCSKLTYAFYLLGLTNLIFGWAHHVYPVPTAKWIRHLAYAISMTEWIVLAKLIWDWKNSLSEKVKIEKKYTYKFLVFTDLWVGLNVFLALLMSIPAINIYTHGTHITVAHAMGTTIGINTSILIAALLYLFEDKIADKKILNFSFWTFQIGLAGFWIFLITAGISKAYHRTVLGESFYAYMQKVNLHILGVYIFSFLVLTALYLLSWVVIKAARGK